MYIPYGLKLGKFGWLLFVAAIGLVIFKRIKKAIRLNNQ